MSGLTMAHVREALELKLRVSRMLAAGMHSLS